MIYLYLYIHNPDYCGYLYDYTCGFNIFFQDHDLSSSWVVQIKLFTPWKINGWNLQITHLSKGKWSSKPPWLCSMLIFRGVQSGLFVGLCSPGETCWYWMNSWRAGSQMFVALVETAETGKAWELLFSNWRAGQNNATCGYFKSLSPKRWHGL